jgi:hypothetical protein
MTSLPAVGKSPLTLINLTESGPRKKWIPLAYLKKLAIGVP